jgi:cytochrome c oxidase assembly protein subunit 11
MDITIPAALPHFCHGTCRLIPENNSTQAKNKRGVLFMFGFCYMLVPLYKLICQKEGLNGRNVMQATKQAADMKIDLSRTIKVSFTTSLHGNLKFKFVPLQRVVYVHPGEGKLIYFFAENQTDNEMTVQAIPSITPADGARFLKKTECFCFTQQYFFKHEKADMPVYFFIDPALEKDIKEITLSYTMFDATNFKRQQEHFTKGRIDL